MDNPTYQHQQPLNLARKVHLMFQKLKGLTELTAIGQGAYYALTGLWAILGIKSFQKITGPKTDIWLVKTVGALVIAIGAALGMAGLRRNETPEITVLGAGSAAALGAIDVVYVACKRISPIYLLDAIAEAGIITMWVLGRERNGKNKPSDA
jgi:hypothetical protein